MELYTVVRLVIEGNPAGGMIPSYAFRTMRMELYQGGTDYVILAIELVLVLFIIYFLIEECKELISSGPRVYFASFYNLLDFIKIFSLSAIVYQRIWMVRAVANLNLDPGDDEYTDFWQISSAVQQEYNIVAINCMVVYWKVGLVVPTSPADVNQLLKYLDISDKTSQLVRVISRASKDIKFFLIILVAVVMGFVFCAYTAFGNYIYTMHTIPLAIMAIFEGINGGMAFDPLYNTNRVFGPIFWIVFFFFALFVLLNMFLAIMTDAYFVVR